MQIIRQPRPVTGILWMLASGLCFVTVTALVKYLGLRLPPVEVAFLRYLLGLVFLIPLIPSMRGATLTSRHWKIFGARGGLHALGVGLWFFSMTRIPIADLTALNFLSPVYVTLGAAVFLGERLAARRVVAICIALIGAAIILRPGFREINPGHYAMLIAGVVFGGSYLLAKIAADEVNPAVVVAMLSVWVTIILLPFAMIIWVPPTLNELAILFAVAFFATAGHFTMTLGLAAAPIATTQPVTFLQLVWATALGVVVFNEAIDSWVIFGGTLILASISYMTWREAVLNRKMVTPPPPATKV